MTATEPLPLSLEASGSAPLVPSFDSMMVAGIELTPAGSGDVTVTANTTVPFAPGWSVPAVNVQVAPGLLSGAHTHPAVEAPGLNTEFAGTTAVRVTPVAPRLPVLE